MTLTAAPGNSSRSLQSGDHDRPAAVTAGWGPHWDRQRGHSHRPDVDFLGYWPQRGFTQEEHPEECEDPKIKCRDE